MAIIYSPEHTQEMAREEREKPDTHEYYLQFNLLEEKDAALRKLELNSQIFNVDENITDYRDDRNNNLVILVKVLHPSSDADEAAKLAKRLGSYRVTRDYKPLYSREI